MGQASQQPIQLPLDAVFVPLNGRIHHTHTPDANQPPPIQPLLTLLHKNDGLVVLGGPGSGKTTWLKYLAHQLASGHSSQLGLANRLPLVLSLSAYATALAAGDLPLSQYLADFYQALGFDEPLDGLFQSALAEGSACCCWTAWTKLPIPPCAIWSAAACSICSPFSGKMATNLSSLAGRRATKMRACWPMACWNAAWCRWTRGKLNNLCGSGRPFSANKTTQKPPSPSKTACLLC
ncbi:MAG: hypothetical protein R3D55_05050 [Chloroflexota bacterium]